MQDRTPTYPGRVKLTPVAGQENTYDMTRADQPTQTGTPLNKSTLLTDATATALGLSGDPTVDDALNQLNTEVSNVFKVGDTLTTTRTDLGDKWLLCNGDVLDTNVYPELTDTLPDLNPTNADSWIKYLNDYPSKYRCGVKANDYWYFAYSTKDSTLGLYTVNVIKCRYPGVDESIVYTYDTGTINYVQDFKKLNNYYVILYTSGSVSNNGHLLISEDLLSWIRSDSNIFPDDTFGYLAYSGNKYWIIAPHSQYMYIWYSEDIYASSWADIHISIGYTPASYTSFTYNSGAIGVLFEYSGYNNGVGYKIDTNALTYLSTGTFSLFYSRSLCAYSDDTTIYLCYINGATNTFTTQYSTNTGTTFTTKNISRSNMGQSNPNWYYNGKYYEYFAQLGVLYASSSPFPYTTGDSSVLDEDASGNNPYTTVDRVLISDDGSFMLTIGYTASLADGVTYNTGYKLPTASVGNMLYTYIKAKE